MASQTEELEDSSAPLISLKQESEEPDSGVEIQAAPLEENKEDDSETESAETAKSNEESAKGEEDDEEDPDLNLGAYYLKLKNMEKLLVVFTILMIHF